MWQLAQDSNAFIPDEMKTNTQDKQIKIRTFIFSMTQGFTLSATNYDAWCKDYCLNPNKSTISGASFGEL